MAIDFPASPSVNDTFTVNGVVYTWDGTKWTAVTPAGDKIVEGNTNAEVIDTGSDGRFVVTTEGTEALRVDASQRVGIGTSTVDSLLHLKGTGTAYSGNVAVGPVLTLEDTSGRITQLVAPGAVGEAGIGTKTSHPLTFFTANTEKARLDQSGRFLVGTSSARVFNAGIGSVTPLVQVEGTGDNNTILSITRNSADIGTPRFILGKSRGVSSGSTTAVQSGDYLGQISFEGTDGTSFNQAARIDCLVDGAPGTNDMPGRLVFSTTADGASSPTERMRISQAGNIGIGVTALNIVRLAIKGQSTTSSDYAFAAYDSSSSDLFNIRNDGLIRTGNEPASPYTNTTGSAANLFVASDGSLQRSTSSIRFKTDIETLQPQYADALLNCRPVWYRSLCANDNPEWGYWGFIAEEVAEIDPRLVFWKTHETKKNEDGNTVQVELEEPIAEGVQYDRFVPHLLNLIKRQGEAIAELQAKVAALEGN